MALETVSSNCNMEPFNFIIYDTISAIPYSCQDHTSETTTFLLPQNCSTSTMIKAHQEQSACGATHSHALLEAVVGNGRCLQKQKHKQSTLSTPLSHHQQQQQQGMRKKRRRKPRACKNKEEAETQRMTHIAVERNRRKQMNEHLALLRSLMPHSYAQRGDQASIVGGAIEYVKELEHLLQSLEAQKLQVVQQGGGGDECNEDKSSTTSVVLQQPITASPFAQNSWSHQQQSPNKYTSKTKAATADIEVTLIETHANLRILSPRISPSQLSKLVAAIQTLQLTILHLTVTSMDPLIVLYSIRVKIEEGCLLTSVDDLAAAIHHMLRLIEETAALC